MFMDFDIRPIIRLRIWDMGLPLNICDNGGVALRFGGEGVPFRPAVDLESDVVELGRAFWGVGSE